jgi:hypothetical protein
LSVIGKKRSIERSEFGAIMAPKKKLSKSELRAQKAKLRAQSRRSAELIDDDIEGGVVDSTEVRIGSPDQRESESLEFDAEIRENSGRLVDPRDMVGGGTSGNLSPVPGAGAVADRQNGDRNICLPPPTDPQLLVDDGEVVGRFHRDVDLQKEQRVVRAVPLEQPRLVRVSGAPELSSTGLGAAEVHSLGAGVTCEDCTDGEEVGVTTMEYRN